MEKFLDRKRLQVRLADFFLADHVTSQVNVLQKNFMQRWVNVTSLTYWWYVFLCLTPQVQAIRSIELYICYYGLGEYSRRQNKCHSHGAYNAFYFVVAVVPFWLRLLQVKLLFSTRFSCPNFGRILYDIIFDSINGDKVSNQTFEKSVRGPMSLLEYICSGISLFERIIRVH